MIARETILERIRKTLSEEFECDPSKIVPEARFYEDLDLDSIDAVDLVVRLQQEIQKKVEPDDFRQIRTLGDVVAAVSKLLNT